MEGELLALLDKLNDQDDQLATLTTIRTFINKQSTMPHTAIVALLRSPALYECAIVGDAAKEPMVSIAVDLIHSAIEQLHLDTSDAELPKLLSAALQHSNLELRSHVFHLLLNELNRQKNAGNILPLPNNELILQVMDELLRKESICSAKAVQILETLLSQWPTDGSVQSKLVELCTQKDFIRCRVYELGVLLAKHSAAALENVEFILNAAMGELDNDIDDILLQASVLEILVPLAEQNHGLLYMERMNIFDIISSRVENIEEKPMDALMIPSVMSFFSKVAAVQPQKIITGYPRMITCLFDLLASDREECLPSAMDALANLASSVHGKTLLQLHYQSSMLATMHKYSEYIKKIAPNYKIRLVNSLEVIFAQNSLAKNDISTFLKTWYESFAGGQQVDHIMELLKTPFPDLQIPALSLLKTLCGYVWGIQSVQRTAGAIEFLLSRNSHLHKDVKLLKWEIMQVLSMSSEFAATDTVRFNTYVNEGPYHFVPNLTRVATEPQP